MISNPRTLHRLIYVSRLLLPEASVEEAVNEIVRASIRNNRSVSITGLLLVHAGFFLQALEGPAEQVMTTYRRILADDRHCDAVLVHAGPVAGREFGDWNMCARRMTPADDAILDTLDQRASFEPHRLNGVQLLRLLTTVRDIQGRTQAAAMA